MESDLIHNIKKESIISCGGGLPIHNNNMQHLLKTGTVIYLKASAKNLYNRLKNKTESRPLINKIQHLAVIILFENKKNPTYCWVFFIYLKLTRIIAILLLFYTNQIK